MAVLIIDDEPGLRRSLDAYLEDMGHMTLTAGDGQEGLEILRADPRRLDAVVVDLNMPVMDGYSFIQHAVQEAPELPIIVLSGVGIVDDALRAIRLGAWDFITKPLPNLEILHVTLNRVLERARLLKENRRYQDHLERLVRERTAELESTRRQIMRRLSRAAEYKDNETGRHVVRVGEISALLSKAVGLPAHRCEMMRDCAPLHDIGKIGIPDAVLLKPDRLSGEEWAIMRQHCMFGCEILGPLSGREEAHASCSLPSALAGEDDNDLLALARVLAMFHHERWDGKGYPVGLQGETIPIEARIVSVVDVYDALCSNRPYKGALGKEESLKILKEGAGTQFDPRIVEAFLDNLDEIEAIREKWKD